MHVCMQAREFTANIARCIHYAIIVVTMYAHTPAYFCQKNYIPSSQSFRQKIAP